MANDHPRTIAELKAFCAAHNMPLEQMRFFLDEDYREPRAFGICRDAEGNFVVYKNKKDGSRAVRYCGPDEAFAVRELYLKLQSETALRYQNGRPVKPTKKQALLGGLAVLLVCALLVYIIATETRDGYYSYGDQCYYHQSDNWYVYNSLIGWEYAYDLDPAFASDPGDYYLGSSYADSYGEITDFADSDYYTASSSDSGWDNDYSSWSASDTNWSSDW